MTRMKEKFPERIKKDIVEKLKIEIENVPQNKLSDVMFNIIIKGREFDLTDKDMKQLKEAYKKRLKEWI